MKLSNQSNTYLYDVQRSEANSLNLLMAYPACKSFALSSLGYMWLSKILDEMPQVNLSQVFTDSTEMPNIQNLDSIAFSISYEMDFMGVFEVLEKLGVEVFSEKRNDILLFAGGPVITSNPAPFDKVFDFFLIGDGEDLIKNVANVLYLNKNASKIDKLMALREVEGVYIPKFANKAKKLSASLTSCVHTPVISAESYFANTFIIEIERGCYNRCGFCLASYLNLPVRYVEFEEIISKIELGLKYTKNIALLGAQVSAHPRFGDICDYVIRKLETGSEININFSSLRVDAVNEQVINLLKLSGQKTFTVAIEAATERLRKVINKNLKEEQLFKALDYAYQGGLKGVKVYCMLGLPTETEDDIRAFIDLAKHLKNSYKGFEITFSFSTFVPKPHTPFQWVQRESNSTLEKKEKILTKELARLGVKSEFSSPKWDYYQTLISRGDSSLNDYLYEVYKLGGKLGAFKAVAKNLGINTDCFVTRNYSLEEELPWDNIIIENPGKELLKNEFNRLMKYSSS